MLASYGLFNGELPPTLIMSIWHGSFSRNRNPFAICYYAHYPSVRASEEERDAACRYLQQFGRTREEQVRAYYLWAQTVPRPLWRYFDLLSLSDFSEIVADMVPPYAISQLLIRLDLYHRFKGAVVLDLFSGGMKPAYIATASAVFASGGAGSASVRRGLRSVLRESAVVVTGSLAPSSTVIST